MIHIIGIHGNKTFNFISNTDNRQEAYKNLLTKWIGSTISIDKTKEKATLVDEQDRFWFCEDYYIDEPFFINDPR